MISQDKKFELVFKFSGLSVNLIYISAFLTNTFPDFILVNLTNWALFIKDLYTEEGKDYFYQHYIGVTLSTYLSQILLISFSLKFAFEVFNIKNRMIFNFFLQKEQITQSWISIFANLPIGMMVVNDKTCVDFNKEMASILGIELKKKKVCYISLTIFRNFRKLKGVIYW